MTVEAALARRKTREEIQAQAAETLPSPEYVRISVAAAMSIGLRPGRMYRDAICGCVNLLLNCGARGPHSWQQHWEVMRLARKLYGAEGAPPRGHRVRRGRGGPPRQRPEAVHRGVHRRRRPVHDQRVSRQGR